jgi:hypothetical protein
MIVSKDARKSAILGGPLFSSPHEAFRASAQDLRGVPGRYRSFAVSRYLPNPGDGKIMSAGHQDDRLLKLLMSKRGVDLVQAIAAEMGVLDAKINALRSELQALEQYSIAAERFMNISAGTEPDEDNFVDRLRFLAENYISPKHNFHNIEYSQDGVPYRWTGPEKEFSFVFLLDRQMPLRVDLLILQFMDVDRQTPLALFIDGARVKCTMMPMVSGSYLVSATIPPRSSKSRTPTEIVYVVREVLQPRSVDTRPLGVAFSELQLSPEPDAEESLPLAPLPTKASDPKPKVDVRSPDNGPRAPLNTAPKDVAQGPDDSTGANGTPVSAATFAPVTRGTATAHQMWLDPTPVDTNEEA